MSCRQVKLQKFYLRYGLNKRFFLRYEVKMVKKVFLRYGNVESHVEIFFLRYERYCKHQKFRLRYGASSKDAAAQKYVEIVIKGSRLPREHVLGDALKEKQNGARKWFLT